MYTIRNDVEKMIQIFEVYGEKGQREAGKIGILISFSKEYLQKATEIENRAIVYVKEHYMSRRKK